MKYEPDRNLLPQGPAMDYASLRQEGLRLLERLAASEWTDFNTHDPGITILEQLCYVLSDLGYRAQYALPDLLARDAENAEASLCTPAEILPAGPVTIEDLRKLVIDVPGVKNAWIDIVDEPSAIFDAALGEVSRVPPPDGGQGPATLSPNVAEIRVKGLYRVQIEKSDLIDIDGGAIRREAARRLHRFRALGEDFEEIAVLEQQLARVNATIEIDAVADATALLASVYQCIAAYMSPSVPFHTLEEMLERGWRVDQIFEGPLLENGFIDPEELARIEWRTSLRVSDLIRELMAVPGVAAVKNLSLVGPDGKPSRDWLINIDPGRTPRFDLQNSDIRLERRSLRIDEGIRDAAQQLFVDRAKEAASPVRSAASERDLRPVPGRDRNVARYHSMQQHFPMAYGVGTAGLPQSAPAERRAQAKQLKAYLMFYDQLLANQFAQLENVGRLFSLHDETQDSYFAGSVAEDADLGLDEIRVSAPKEHRELLQRITEDPRDPDAPASPSAPAASPGARRRNRFLDHLLARFGEQFRDYALLRAGADAGKGAIGAAVEARLAHQKRAFLRDYPRIGRDRGAAFNYLEPTSEGSPDFLPGDVRDPAAWIRKLADASPDSLDGNLWGQLRPGEKAALTNAGATRGEAEAGLIDALNRIIRGGVSLYVAERFAGVSLSRETERLLAAALPPSDPELTKLNRLLLEDAYPENIARSLSEDNLSGLERSLRRKLGIEKREERFHIVEHVLLRPMAGDGQKSALFRAAKARDPYSLQISFVFPKWPARYQDANFRAFVEHTVREESPAHLTAYVLWKEDEPAMRAFESAYGVWLHQWRNHRRAGLGF